MNELNNLKQEFTEAQNKFAEMLNSATEQSTHIVLTKGKLCNVFPYEHELQGRGKLNAVETTEIPHKTMSDNYFKTHFNSEKQVVLCEQWQFGKFRYFSFYHYELNLIKQYEYFLTLPDDDKSHIRLETVSLFHFEKDKAVKCYKAEHHYNVNKFRYYLKEYFYSNGKLAKIFDKYNSETYTFEYDKDNLLSKIVRTLSEKEIQQIYPKVRWIKTND
jgi:hypothetical protein